MENTPKDLSKAHIDLVLFNFLQSIYLYDHQLVETFSVSWSDIYLMQLLRRRPQMRLTLLAQMMKAEPFVTSRQVTRLQKLGFVERQSDRGDKRAVQIGLSDLGEEKLRAIEDHNYKIIEWKMPTFNQEQMQMMLDTIGNLDQLLNLEVGR